ncbi:hypothetical protein DP917_10505 [Escherichia coli]|nr:hypothetical protein [Escherichia coli]EFC1522428.1 hypothetical protein [Escherichia coli]EFC2237932.1 hypothetical protein [Escherichia coli]EFO2308078.1 hypothetical protein [Escherichia coli]
MVRGGGVLAGIYPAVYPVGVNGLYSKNPSRGRASLNEMGLKAGFICLPACLSSWEVKLSSCHLSCLCRSDCRSRLSCT